MRGQLLYWYWYTILSADLTAATVTILKYKILHIYEIIHFLIDPV